MSESDYADQVKELPNETGFSGFINKPKYLLLFIVGSIFVSETLVMLLLMFLPPLNSYQEAFIDASFLSLLVFPALYILVFRPLHRQIKIRMQAEAEKDALIVKLQKALNEVNTLRGMLPICALCKKIRDDKGYWQQIEDYISGNSDVLFTHGICPECAKKIYPQFEDDKES